MNSKQYWVLIGLLGITLGFCATLILRPSTVQYGGTVQGTRTTFTTIDGNMGSTTNNAIGGVYIVPTISALATSTLITDVDDVDDLTFFASFVASSSQLVVVGVQFYESNSATCGTNNASTTWYALGGYTSIGQPTVLSTTSTTFTYTPAASTTIQGFAFKVPFTAAQCVQARVFAGGPVPTNPNFFIWYGFASQRKGYNNGN